MMFAHISAARRQRLHLSLPALAILLLLLGVLAACGSVTGSHAPFPQNKFSVLKMPAPYVLLGQIIPGPDGTLWFPTVAYANFTTKKPSGAIGRLTPGGQVSIFPLTTSYTYPTAITFTRDGTLWFIAFQGNGQLAPNVDTAPHFTSETPEIGRMTPAGHFSFFAFPSDTIYPAAIATGSDGNLWLAEDDNTNGVTSRHIARMTPSGAFTDFTLPTLSQYDYLQRLIAGPDGNLWFFLDTDYRNAASYIGKISSQGNITLYSLGKYNAVLDMTVGPDHAIWFTSYSLIGRITTTGQVSWFNPNPHKNPDTLIDIAGIITGPDGNLWFATANQAVGRLTPSGTFTFYPLPSNYDFDAGSSSLTMNQFKDIATASDGTLWLTDGDQLGHFS